MTDYREEARRTRAGRPPRAPVDPDLAVVVSLIFSAIAALGSLTTAVVHLLGRIDAERAKRKSTRARLAKWGQSVKSLSNEVRRFREFLGRVRPDSTEMVVIGTTLQLSPSDALVYRDFVARLAKLVKDATARSMDLTESLTGEAERRARYATRKLEEMKEGLRAAIDEQHHDVAVLWGARRVEEFLAGPERVTSTLAKFEADLQQAIQE